MYVVAYPTKGHIRKTHTFFWSLPPRLPLPTTFLWVAKPGRIQQTHRALATPKVILLDKHPHKPFGMVKKYSKSMKSMKDLLWKVDQLDYILQYLVVEPLATPGEQHKYKEQYAIQDAGGQDSAPRMQSSPCLSCWLKHVASQVGSSEVLIVASMK